MSDKEKINILRKALKKLDQTLAIPAAEYVPAIADALLIIEKALKETKPDTPETE